MNVNRFLQALLGAAFLLLLGACASARRTAQKAPLRPALSAQDQRRHDYFLLEAQAKSSSGHPEEAFQLYSHALHIDSLSPAANYSIAPFYLFLGDDSTALEALHRAVRYEPDNYWYNRVLALCYFQLNRADEAVPVLEQMTRRFPDRQEPYFTLLDLYGRRGNYEKMLSVLNRIEALVGPSEEFSVQKSQLYFQLGKDAEGFREIQNLINEYPQESRYTIILGQLYLDKNRPEEARQLFEMVLADDPDNMLATYSMADYYRATHQDEAYQEQISRLLYNRSTSVDTKLAVMRQLIADNDALGADSIPLIPVFDRILQEDPDDDQIPMLYAQYLWSKNRSDQSAPVLERILQIDPLNKAARLMLLQVLLNRNDAEGLYNLCQVGTELTPEQLQFPYFWALSALQLGRFDQAKKACLQAVGNLTGNEEGPVVSDLYTILGDISHEEGDVETCFSYYEQALRYNPLNYGVLNNYAYFLSLEGRDLDRAEEMSHKTVQAHPDNATYLDTYAWVLFVKERYTEARIYIDNALKSEEGSTSSSILEHGGDIYYHLGEKARALELWKQAAQFPDPSELLDEKIRRAKYIAP